MTKDNVGVRYAPAPFCLEKGAEYFETQDFVYISKKIHLAENFFYHSLKLHSQWLPGDGMVGC